MKTKTLLAILMGTVVATAAYGQGSFNFNNYDCNAPISIINTPANAMPGPAGAYVGSDYSASFIWGYGTLTSPSQLLNTWTGDPVPFSGTTGGSPSTDFAGIFYASDFAVLDNSGGNVVTIQVQAWYNGGTYSTFLSAMTDGVNCNPSDLITLTLATGANTPPSITFPAFTLWGGGPQAPEPSTMALAGLGAAALFLFRRRR